MYTTRILTAVTLASLLIWMVVVPPAWLFVSCISIFVMLAAWEWGRLSLGRARSACFWCLGVSLALILLHNVASALVWIVVILTVMGIWLCGLVMAPIWLARNSVLRCSAALWLLLGLGVLLPSWCALALLAYQAQEELLLLILISVWLLDSGSFWAGARWGKRRLAPAVSPGKTWVGLWGGLGTSLPVSLAYVIWQDMPLGGASLFLLLALLSLCCAVVGDLFESMLKRAAGEKDSGNILPGHGGILDRIDGLCAAAPVWVGGLFLSGYLS